MMKFDGYMSSDDVCKYLDFSVTTLYRLIKRNRIPYFKVDHKYKFKQADIDKWVAKQNKRRGK